MSSSSRIPTKFTHLWDKSTEDKLIKLIRFLCSCVARVGYLFLPVDYYYLCGFQVVVQVDLGCVWRSSFKDISLLLWFQAIVVICLYRCVCRCVSHTSKSIWSHILLWGVTSIFWPDVQCVLKRPVTSRWIVKLAATRPLCRYHSLKPLVLSSLILILWC